MKEKIALGLLSAIAVIALITIVASYDDAVTGALAGQQKTYGSVYRMRYHANPCSLLSCKGGMPETMGYDPVSGNAICRCPKHSQPYFQISHWRKQ